MEKRVKVFATFLVAVLLVTGLYLFTDWFSKVTGYFSGESEKEKLAQCLSEQGAEFYYTIQCPDCEKQKQVLGDSMKLLSTKNCGSSGELCPNIKSFPAFYMNKSINYGFLNLTQLDKISGCDVISS